MAEQYTGKRKGEAGDLGQRSRESKWIMISFNQISTTNKTFPRIPQPVYHPHISRFANLSMKTQLSLPYSGVLVDDRAKTSRGGGENFSPFSRRGISTGRLSPGEGAGKIVGGFETTIRARNNERAEEGAKETIRGYCQSIPVVATRDSQERER